MERRCEVRLQELLDEAVVEPEPLEGMLARLEQRSRPAWCGKLARRWDAPTRCW